MPVRRAIDNVVDQVRREMAAGCLAKADEWNEQPFDEQAESPVIQTRRSFLSLPTWTWYNLIAKRDLRCRADFLRDDLRGRPSPGWPHITMKGYFALMVRSLAGARGRWLGP